MTAIIPPQPEIISNRSFKINHNDIDPCALEVVRKLQKAGFDGYIVGGGVRDLLAGLKPKDFDIATNATPEQVKQTLKNTRIIGKRFRLAHVYFRLPGQYKQHIIEVATYRACHSQATDDTQATMREGRIIRDNVYGTIAEDALRRDFTVNALYYDPIKKEILDFTQGMHDLKEQKIHLIGTPEIRYQEDPVRILRALRISNKLGFQIEENTRHAIAPSRDLLDSISPARLFDEYCKLFLLGRAEKNFNTLNEYQCLTKLFPSVVKYLGQKKHDQLIMAALQNTDQRIAQGKTINPAFLISAFLWCPLNIQQAELNDQGEFSPHDIRVKAPSVVLREQAQTLSIPKRFTMAIRDIWGLQRLLEIRRPRVTYKVLEHPRFRAAYDFLLLRAQAGDVDPVLAHWWTEIQVAKPDRRQRMIKDLKS